MSRQRRPDPKTETLHEQGVYNPRADRVTDPLFTEEEFFDPRDLVQVRYELLRRVTKEGMKVVDAARSFGLSRDSYYKLLEKFRSEGLAGLLPKKRGPKAPHKVTPEIEKFIEEKASAEESHSDTHLTDLVEDRFGVRVHPRTITRARERLKKKRR